MEVGKLIAQGRMGKSLTQKELATARDAMHPISHRITAAAPLTAAQKINEKPQVIGDYENGRCAPDHAVLGKIERVIGLHAYPPGAAHPGQACTCAARTLASRSPRSAVLN